MSTEPRTTDNEPATEFWLRKLFDYIDTDAMIQREKLRARDPLNPGRNIVGLTLQAWENFVRPKIVAALAAERASGGLDDEALTDAMLNEADREIIEGPSYPKDRRGRAERLAAEYARLTGGQDDE